MGRRLPFRLPCRAAVCVLLLLAFGSASEAALSSDDLWRGLTTATPSFRLERSRLEAVLAQAPMEGRSALDLSQAVLSVPMPDGSLARFQIEESPLFEPELAAQHPEIRSFRGRGIDLPGAMLRCDWTPFGFHALVLASGLTVTVYPETQSPDAPYVSIQAGEVTPSFECGVTDVGRIGGEAAQGLQVATGSQLRTYRIAISTTGEFTQTVGGGTVSGALAALNTILTGINAVYERDLAVHVNLIAGLTPVIYTNAATDPYTNGDTNAMIDQVTAALGANIPSGNYDVGHVIGTNSGGLAGIGVVCDNSMAVGGPRKGAGVSAASLPVGNSGDIGLISHEIGHQFGAAHTQNANCSRSSTNGVEPGSGVTIMSYNGVCSPNNTVPIGELRFHAWSLGLMNSYIATQACQVSTATGNSVPSVNGGPDRTIPVNTPFTLSASGNDPDAGDLANLTYTWEQVDPGQLNGLATDYPNPPYQDQPGDPATTTRPILTPVASSASPARTFPRLAYVLNNANDPPDQVNGLFTAEELPRVARTLNFKVTVRDNHAGGGGTSDDLVTLTVSGAAGPFQVTAPNGGETWITGSTRTVTWNVSNTNAAPVSCTNVKISLSLDGGNTFPIVLVAVTGNDGSQTITVPSGLNSTTARVKVEAVANVFFDVSNANFTINAGPGCPFVTSVLPAAGNVGTVVTLGGSGFTGVTGVRFNNSIAAVFTVMNDATITATVPAGAVNGPITLTKTGCPSVQTADFAVCPNPSLLAQVDDGSGETFWAGAYFVNRLTPSAYPATVSQVLIETNSFGFPPGTPINVLYGANPGGTANIGGVVFQSVAGTSGPDGVFKTFDVPLLTINSGDFVVGFNVGTAGFPGYSDTGAPAGRSYVSSDGTFGSSTVASNHLIRARYFTSCATPAACPSVSNLNPTSGLVGSYVIISGANLAGVTGVAFTNNVAAWFTVDNPSQITAMVPAGATNGPLTVTKPGCSAVQTAAYTVNPPGTAHVCVSPGTAIPDNNPTGITSNLVVPDDLSIMSLTVTVNIQHTFIGDLIVELRHGATTVRLHNRTGGNSQNIVGTYPTTFTVDGPGTLADFNGQSSSGTWTLFVSDNAAADTGTLTQWCLDITGNPATAGVEPSAGAISFRIAPNPAIDGSSIRLALPQAGLVRVRVIDLAGRLVRRVQDGWVPAGPQEFRWDGRDGSGARVESGIYFVAVEGVGVRLRGKLVVTH